MKILLLCKKFPFPLKDGESIAVHSLSQAMSELGCEVSLLAMNTSKHYFGDALTTPDLAHYRQIQTVAVDNRLNVWDAARNLLSEDSYHISRFVSTDFATALRQMLQATNYDIVQLETLYLAPYVSLIRQYSDAAICMRAHNVEHEIWERIASNCRPGPYQWYLRYLSNKLRRYEISQLNAYDWLAPITQRDARRFQSMGARLPSLVTPIGLPTHRYHPDYDSYRRPLSISFIGSLDWKPNLEGLQWYLDKVWPKARKRFPKIDLYVAGRNTPGHMLQSRKRGVHIMGEVPSARQFINQHSLMIVPLLSGSGMRAKILEGMALGKVVITTRIGLEGIPARHKQEVLIADTPEEFLWALDYCKRRGGRLERIGRRAQAFIEEQFDSLAVAENLLRVYREGQEVAV